jgi:hypothetical protein
VAGIPLLLKVNNMKKIIIGFVIFLLSGLAGTRAGESINTNFHPTAGVHNILSSKLPPVLLTEIKKDYKGYWITELYEEGKPKRTSYFITLENADEIIKLSCADSENWVVKSTTMKAV